jgi:phosphate transport system protein
METELQHLKEEVNAMWGLVISQLKIAGTCLFTNDKGLARSVLAGEKRVNRFELEIDDACENLLALHAPVAVDLRFVLAVLRINSNLERIGDIAEGIAKYVLDAGAPFTPEIVTATQIKGMHTASVGMLEDTFTAFAQGDTTLARGVFTKDAFLDKVNTRANGLIGAYLAEYPADLNHALYLLAIIRKLERVGDQAKNIAEEIIFYLEATVLKHSNKSYRLSGIAV